MPDTTLRYLAMLEFIPREPDSVSVEEIIQALNRRGFFIDKRSVQRDLKKLSQPFNLESWRDAQSNRWSYLKKAPVMFLPSMDEHTALSFQLMQAFLQHLLPPETLDSIDPWFKKAAVRLSQRKGAAAKWQEKIHVLPLGLPRQPPTIVPKVQVVVYQALLNEHPLRVQYRSRSSEKFKEYVISPLGLVIRDYVSYVVAVMNDSGKEVYLPLQRFKDADIELNAKYLRPTLFNLKAYAKENFGFQMSESPTVDLELWMDEAAAKSVAECPVDKRQTMVEQADGSFLLSATVPNTLELRRWIHSFGNQVEVLQPGHLRNDFSVEIAAMSERYKTRKKPR